MLLSNATDKPLRLKIPILCLGTWFRATERLVQSLPEWTLWHKALRYLRLWSLRIVAYLPKSKPVVVINDPKNFDCQCTPIFYYTTSTTFISCDYRQIGWTPWRGDSTVDSPTRVPVQKRSQFINYHCKFPSDLTLSPHRRYRATIIWRPFRRPANLL